MEIELALPLPGGATADDVERAAWDMASAVQHLATMPAPLLARNLDYLLEAQDALASAIHTASRRH